MHSACTCPSRGTRVCYTDDINHRGSVRDYVHGRGLGFGLYGDKGSLDCAKHPGSLGREAQDAAFLARHQIDWWKEDSCYSDSGDHAKAIADYAKMRDALNATRRRIWFALCGWETVRTALRPLAISAITFRIL